MVYKNHTAASIASELLYKPEVHDLPDYSLIYGSEQKNAWVPLRFWQGATEQYFSRTVQLGDKIGIKEIFKDFELDDKSL